MLLLLLLLLPFLVLLLVPFTTPLVLLRAAPFAPAVMGAAALLAWRPRVASASVASSSCSSTSVRRNCEEANLFLSMWLSAESACNRMR